MLARWMGLAIVVNMLRARWSVVAALVALPAAIAAQDRLKSMAGYEPSVRVAREAPTAVTGGALTVTWMDGGTAFQYTSSGKLYRYDIASAQARELETSDADAGRSALPGRGGRGQFTGVPG